MAKVIVDFEQTGLTIASLTWSACKRDRDQADVSTAGATLTPFGSLGAYWLENPNVTELTSFQIYITGNLASVIIGEFDSFAWASGPTPPPASALAVCNNAVLALGGNVFASFTDTQAEAVICTNLWASAVDAVLRLHPWNCAIKRAALAAPDVTPPAYEWTAAFTLPSDLLRILELNGVTDYKIEGGKVLCNEAALNVRYVYRNSNPATWDALLIQAMTAYMQFVLAYPVTKSNTVKDAQWKLFTELLRSAKHVDAQDEPGETLGDFPFLDVRG